MKFDISLTTTRSTSQEEADTFIGAMTSRGFSVIQGRVNDRYGDKVYIAFTLCPMEIPAAANKGGRPRKLTDEQVKDALEVLTAHKYISYVPPEHICAIYHFFSIKNRKVVK